MNKRDKGFEISEKDIDTALRYLKFEKGIEDATKEDAIALLEDHLALAHLLAHKVVEDEQSGKIEPVKLEESSSEEKPEELLE